MHVNYINVSFPNVGTNVVLPYSCFLVNIFSRLDFKYHLSKHYRSSKMSLDDQCSQTGITDLIGHHYFF